MPCPTFRRTACVCLHLCWGIYEGPHHHDVALRDIIDIVLQARPLAISFEASNPRHAHEWQVLGCDNHPTEYAVHRIFGHMRSSGICVTDCVNLYYNR